MLERFKKLTHIDDMILMCNECNEIIYAQMKASLPLDIEVVEVRNTIVKHLMNTQQLTTILYIN